jgi:hypothetical protein
MDGFFFSLIFEKNFQAREENLYVFKFQDFAMYNRAPIDIPRVTGVMHGQLNSLGGVLDYENLMFAGIEYR